MTLDAVIMLFGAFVAVFPFLQFPPNWDTTLLFIAGVVIFILGILVRRSGKTSPQQPPVSRRTQFVDAPQRMDDIRQ